MARAVGSVPLGATNGTREASGRTTIVMVDEASPRDRLVERLEVSQAERVDLLRRPPGAV
jgi:hypothetical protein